MKSIKQEYSSYISEIDYIMKNLENERYYERSGAQMDGYLANNIIKLRNELNEMMYALQKNTLGIQEPDKKIFQSYEERNKSTK